MPNSSRRPTAAKSKAEIRMMFIWPEDGEPVLVNNLVRMSQGKMMGVNFNKNKTWVGSSIALHALDASERRLYFSSSFVSANAFTANSKSSRECAADTCVRTRAVPCGTTGIEEADDVNAFFQHARGELLRLARRRRA